MNQMHGLQGGRRRPQEGEDGVDIENDEANDEINRLQEIIMIQRQLFRATEDENRKLKDQIVDTELMNSKILNDLNAKSEKRETLVSDLRSKVGEYAKEISGLKEKDLIKSYKILELEDKLVESATDSDILRLENLSLQNKLKVGDFSQLNDVKSKNAKLEDEIAEYEGLVQDLKKQIVPMENIKQKMASLDEDVVVLKRRLQGSMRSKTKVQKSSEDEIIGMQVLGPFSTSTKKRRMSPIQVMSPAKVIKIADVVEGAEKPTDMKAEKEGPAPETVDARSRSLKMSRSKIGQECKQQ